ncbi:MAG TPA: translation initiation factor IF-2 [Melioribacteraceae bacterium]|nr:translation initiation factor IF-2 [Melioribacteraceae bacterium]
MSEEMTPKKEKIRLYKFASEYNISTDTLMSFLKEKGYEIKSYQTPLTETMINDIMAKFKKEIEKAEKHNQKVSEFNKKRGEAVEEIVKPVAVISEQVEKVYQELKQDIVEKQQVIFDDEPMLFEEPKSVNAVAEEVKVEEPVENRPVIEEVKEEQKPVIEEEPIKEVLEKPVLEIIEEEPKEKVVVDASTSVEETVAEVIEVVTETDTPAGVYKTRSEIEIENKKRGLTILGKMNLGKPKKDRDKEQQHRDKDRNKDNRQVRDNKEERPARDNREERPNKGREKGEPVRENKFVIRDATPEDLKMDPNLKLIEAEQSEGLKKKKKKKKVKLKKGVELSVEEQIKAKKKRKIKKLEVDKKEVEAAIKRTLLSMEDNVMIDRANARKKKRKEKLEIQERLMEEQIERNRTHIKVTEFVAVNELANLMKVQVSEVIQKCIGLGLMVSINQRLDVETITLVADEFGFEVEIEDEFSINDVEDIIDPEETLKPRPPVVTIMGHVDHGKTSLLDYIRKTRVVFGESGGITQHIGAYQVKTDSGKLITFLDTPGHEAFTAMRARGARVTDIVVLVVAADDAVMPQTIEAINHAMAANVPIIVAINKIDKPNSNPEKIRQQLADRNILVEDWGGRYQCVELSAKAGINVDQLLEKILIEAEMMELTANPDRMAYGAIIETQIDKGRGITATILVQKGTLKVGDPFVAGIQYGRVRAMFDERNEKVEEAGPATPVLVLGYEGPPQAGDTFVVVESEKAARTVALKRQQIKREQDQKQVHLITLDEIASQISIGGVKELPIIVKGDVDGSVEALSDAFMKLTNKEVVVRVIHKGVGAITEGDVLLAAASRAIIIGFHVRPNSNARKLAETEKIDIRLYNVIYDAINEVRSALEGLLAPVISEEQTATVEVRQLFKLPKLGIIAGCYVQNGKLHRTNKVRVIRDGIQVFTGDISSLKRLKDDVKEVDAGYECGLNIASYNDLRVGDIIESYKIIETKKKLEQV